MTTCIDLKATYGTRFKVAYEESYHAQHGRRDARDALWLQIIPGRLGHVFPHGGNLLAASTNSNGPTARRLAALPGVVLWQNGSDGVTVLFPPEQLEAVAALIHLKRRRVLSEAARQQLAAAGATTRFRHGVGCPGESAVCVGSD